MTQTERPAGICPIDDDPAIYVACLASYNAGHLHGAWINLSVADTAEEIQECIDWILKTSPAISAEEYAVHDSQGLCGPCKGTEWPELENLEELARAYNSICPKETDWNGSINWIAYRIICNNDNELLSEDYFHERFCGVFERPEDYAYDLAENCGHDIDGAKWPFNCIDWKRAWHELSTDGFSAEYNSEAGGYIITTPA